MTSQILRTGGGGGGGVKNPEIIVAIVLPYIQEFPQNYHFNLFRKFGQHFPLHKYKLGYRKDEMEATKLFSYI